MLDPRDLSAGQEQFEEFYPRGEKRTEFNKRVQYDYRHTNGKLFSTIAVSLEEARLRRDNWILRQDQTS
jgi:hypothetical protein